MKEALLKLLDYLLIPGLILVLLYDPNFLHGLVDVLESGQYLSTSNSIFEGKVPYKDFFILFGPFQTYTIALVMTLFGKSLSVLRTFFYMNYIIAFLIIYILGRQVCKKRFFVYLIPFICLVEVSQPFWAARWDFGRMGLGLLVLLFIILFLKKNNTKLLFGAGIISSITIFYTLDVGAIAIVSSIFTLAVFSFTRQEKTLKDNALHFSRNIFWYGLGILVILIPFFIFMYSKGALFVYLKTVFYVLPKYHMATWKQQYLPSFWTILSNTTGFSLLRRNLLFNAYLPTFTYIAIFFYLLYSFYRHRWNEEKVVIFLLFVYGAVCYRTSFRSIMGPQFQVSLPPLIMLICLFLEKGFDFLT